MSRIQDLQNTVATIPAFVAGKSTANLVAALNRLMGVLHQISPREKAVKTLKELQAMADWFAVAEKFESMVGGEISFEDAFYERFGLYPEHVRWFAGDREVGLSELFAMIINVEGGGLGESEEMAIYIANRIRYYSFGADKFYPESLTDLLTVKDLLETYGEGQQGTLAYNIINNILAHDDSFFGARDFEERPHETVQQAWRNLTRDPRNTGQGDLIVRLSEAIIDEELWRRGSYSRQIEGLPVFTYANHDLIPERALKDLNDRLRVYGLGSVEQQFTVRSNDYVVFLNRCQDIVRREQDHLLVANGCISCGELRRINPALLEPSGCTEA